MCTKKSPLQSTTTHIQSYTTSDSPPSPTCKIIHCPQPEQRPLVMLHLTAYAPAPHLPLPTINFPSCHSPSTVHSAPPPPLSACADNEQPNAHSHQSTGCVGTLVEGAPMVSGPGLALGCDIYSQCTVGNNAFCTEASKPSLGKGQSAWLDGWATANLDEPPNQSPALQPTSRIPDNYLAADCHPA